MLPEPPPCASREQPLRPAVCPKAFKVLPFGAQQLAHAHSRLQLGISHQTHIQRHLWRTPARARFGTTLMPTQSLGLQTRGLPSLSPGLFRKIR